MDADSYDMSEMEQMQSGEASSKDKAAPVGTNASSPAKDNTEPILGADGVKAFTLEEISSIIRKEHGRALYQDDPVMMTVTIMNVYLEELQKLYARHEKVTKKIMAEETSRYIASVDKVTASLAKTLSDNSTKALETAFSDHSKAMGVLHFSLDKTRMNGWYCAAISAIAAITVLASVFFRRF